MKTNHLFNSILTGVLLSFFIHPVLSNSNYDLTGTWNCNDGGTYYLRQIGNELWWYGDSNPKWTNVYKGTVRGDKISGEWADVPMGRDRNSGKLELEIVSPDKLRRTLQTGNFAGSEWTRKGGATSSGSSNGNFIKEVFVPANKKGETPSGIVLKNGLEYTIEVSGTFSVYPGSRNDCDALYDWHNPGDRKYRSQFRINQKKAGDMMEAEGVNREYRSDHVYRIKVLGKGEALRFKLYDWGDYSNNTDGVDVKIYGSEYGNDTGSGSSDKLLKTVTVPSKDKDGVSSGYTLKNGVDYTLKISGTFSVYPGRKSTCDALYDWNDADNRKYRSFFRIDQQQLGELMKEAGKNISYRSDHVYELKITGKGKRLTFQLYDWGNYSNNTDGVKVEIYGAGN